MSWLVGEDKARRALKKKSMLLEESDVTVMPELVSSAITDQAVAINNIKKYFTSEAWLLVQDVVRQKQAETTSCVSIL